LAASHRWLHRLATALLLGALAAYVVALFRPATIVMRFGGRPFMRFGWEMLASVAHPYGATPTELALWSLNLLVLATPLLWGLRPRRLYALAPFAALAFAFWIWGATPSSAAELATAEVIWQLEPGYFLWLSSILVICASVTLRWTAWVLAARAWQRRDSAPNARLGVDAAAIAHFSPSLRIIIQEAADLRRLLDAAPDDERVQSMLWDFVMRLRRLPEADAAELERLRVPTRDVHAAVEPLWLTECALGPDALARVDDALESFLTAATTGGHAAAFR
jgi:hypothetical protein